MVRELEEAEAYEVKLRQCIIEARDQLAAGHTSVALSILNTALNDIDAATDVVAGSPERRCRGKPLTAGRDARAEPLFAMDAGAPLAWRPRVARTADWRNVDPTLGVLPTRASAGESTPLVPVRIMPAQGSVDSPLRSPRLLAEELP